MTPRLYHRVPISTRRRMQVRIVAGFSHVASYVTVSEEEEEDGSEEASLGVVEGS